MMKGSLVFTCLFGGVVHGLRVFQPRAPPNTKSTASRVVILDSPANNPDALSGGRARGPVDGPGPPIASRTISSTSSSGSLFGCSSSSNNNLHHHVLHGGGNVHHHVLHGPFSYQPLETTSDTETTASVPDQSKCFLSKLLDIMRCKCDCIEDPFNLDGLDLNIGPHVSVENGNVYAFLCFKLQRIKI